MVRLEGSGTGSGERGTGNGERVTGILGDVGMGMV